MIIEICILKQQIYIYETVYPIYDLILTHLTIQLIIQWYDRTNVYFCEVCKLWIYMCLHIDWEQCATINLKKYSLLKLSHTFWDFRSSGKVHMNTLLIEK